MAFTRMYHARDSMGDPFRLRMPKKLRKLQVGRALGKAARMGAQFIPGVGGIVAQMIPGLQEQQMQAPVPEAAQLPPAGAEWDDENPGDGFSWVRPPAGHPAWSFARANGWDMGDPKVSKRKSAGAGPKVKAAAKASKRQAKASGMAPKHKGSSARGKQGAGSALARNFMNAAGSMGGSAMKALRGGGVQSLAGEAFNFDPQAFAGGGIRAKGAGGRRSMNVTNVKALRRGLRRLEGFEKLVKRIEKQYPRLKRAAHGGGGGGRPGHKSGCKCVACR